jgi:hypothetical protein
LTQKRTSICTGNDSTCKAVHTHMASSVLTLIRRAPPTPPPRARLPACAHGHPPRRRRPARAHRGVWHAPHGGAHRQHVVELEGLAVALAVQVLAQAHVAEHVCELRVQHLLVACASVSREAGGGGGREEGQASVRCRHRHEGLAGASAGPAGTPAAAALAQPLSAPWVPLAQSAPRLPPCAGSWG